MNEATIKISDELTLELKSYFDKQDVKDAIAATEKAADSDVGTFEIVISTENVDRYQDVIKLDAWEDELYLKNPVVLWDHDHKQLPVGITTSLRVEDGKKIATGKFAPHAAAQEIRKLYDLGVLRAASVGFIEKERQGNLITKAELIEWSIVSVPANPYCLSTLHKSGVSVNELVTKGLVFIEKDAEIVEKPVDTPQEETNEKPKEHPADEPAEKNFNIQEIVSGLSALKDAVVALEAAVNQNRKPERNEDTPEETEEEKSYREFSDKRKLLQDASTVLSEVLAEARQAKKVKSAV